MKTTVTTLAITTSLTAASFIADLEAIAGISKHIVVERPTTDTTVTIRTDKPTVISGFPQLDEGQEMSLSLFRVRFAAYGYIPITAIAVATDRQAAIAKANIVKRELERGEVKEHPNLQLRMDVFEDTLSNEEVIQLAAKAEVMITIC